MRLGVVVNDFLSKAIGIAGYVVGSIILVAAVYAITRELAEILPGLAVLAAIGACAFFVVQKARS
jgi:hypothetical protein